MGHRHPLGSDNHIQAKEDAASWVAPFSDASCVAPPLSVNSFRRYFFSPSFEPLESRLAPAVYKVTMVTDLAPLGGGQRDPGDPTGKSGDLRYAVTQAIAGPGNSVQFDCVPAGGGTAPAHIQPAALLPAISTPITLDGTTQPGYTAGGEPQVWIDGSFAGFGPGLDVTAGNTAVKALAIYNFTGDGIDLTTNGGDTVAGCHIGTNPGGNVASPNTIDGIFVDCPNNTIGGITSGGNSGGGTAAVGGNLISGNAGNGITITGNGQNNRIFSNLIGTDVTGTTAIPNGVFGIRVVGGNNWIGNSFGIGGGNLISGNTSDGVRLDPGAASNIVAGDFIGTDTTGMVAIPNQGNGVALVNANSNWVGGNVNPNIISGNALNGVSISGPQSHDNILFNDWIGVNQANAKPGNGQAGIEIGGAANKNQVGSPNVPVNVISGNATVGVLITDSNTSQNTVVNSYIGTDLNGTSKIPNGTGVELASGASNNTIGGATQPRNVISGNTGNGVYVLGGSNNNTILSNWIGVDKTGNNGLGNGNGIEIDGSSGTIIQSDVISANQGVAPGAGDGIYIHNGGSNTQITGCYIGLGANGTARLGNQNDGIYISVGAGVGNAVGVAGMQKNYISGNGGWGVDDHVADPAIVNNVIGFDIGLVPDNNTLGGASTVTPPGAGNTIQP
jgi:hypothetical protein